MRWAGGRNTDAVAQRCACPGTGHHHVREPARTLDDRGIGLELGAVAAPECAAWLVQEYRTFKRPFHAISLDARPRQWSHPAMVRMAAAEVGAKKGFWYLGRPLLGGYPEFDECGQWPTPVPLETAGGDQGR